ncbi:hypothetical protein BLNAU_14912 [Blattamonas nauphoetae]|uniref:Uncharacterized protein n=1 Tax=Blattamonas nauphoetae TaxID=2049346 RepID=A0ABQ9XIV6_9EUKA|nr:hypothetical protein BLNAU_14912 [Blattamonas nauphoetae]
MSTVLAFFSVKNTTVTNIFEPAFVHTLAGLILDWTTSNTKLEQNSSLIVHSSVPKTTSEDSLSYSISSFSLSPSQQTPTPPIPHVPTTRFGVVTGQNGVNRILNLRQAQVPNHCLL